MKLWQIEVYPPDAMYCAGGWAVVAADTPEEALALLNGSGVHADAKSVIELPVPDGPGVLFLETYQE